MAPENGYYKKILTDLPEVDLQPTDLKVSGVTAIIPDRVLDILDGSDDRFAPYYAEKIRKGKMVPIVHNRVV